VNVKEYEPPSGPPFDAVFSILCLFALSRREIEDKAMRWSRWVRVGGIICICSIPAEDFQPETRGVVYDPDGLCAKDIGYRFMATDVKITLMARKGWEILLDRNRFEILDTMTSAFTPPKAAQSDNEVHYYIIARKVR
jgi:hypothetical protein